jgi:SAM-dependent methyltransferase
MQSMTEKLAAPDTADGAKLKAGSPDRFGYSWARYAEILPAHEAQFLRWTATEPGFWKGRRFLDAGCGIGRNSYWPMSYGAESCLSVDVDDRTLAAARENLAGFPRAEVRKQSIYEVEASADVDIAFSIGVVHHLADPAAAVAALVRAARPGGQVLVWLYGRENNGWIVYLFNPLRRALFSRLPLRVVHALSWPLTFVLRLGLKAGIPRGAYFRSIRDYDFEHLQAIVFDHMIPQIALYYTREQAEDLLRKAGLTDVASVWVNENSWSVRGTKPQVPAAG